MSIIGNLVCHKSRQQTESICKCVCEHLLTSAVLNKMYWHVLFIFCPITWHATLGLHECEGESRKCAGRERRGNICPTLFLALKGDRNVACGVEERLVRELAFRGHCWGANLQFGHVGTAGQSQISLQWAGFIMCQGHKGQTFPYYSSEDHTKSPLKFWILETTYNPYAKKRLLTT